MEICCWTESHPRCLLLWKWPYPFFFLRCCWHLVLAIVATSAACATWSACNTRRPDSPNSASMSTGYHDAINSVLWMAYAIAVILFFPTYGALLFTFQYAPKAHRIFNCSFSFFSKLVLSVFYAHTCSVGIVPTLYCNASKSAMPVFAMSRHQPIQSHLIINFNHTLSSFSQIC